jgi:hypothetical protein
VKPTESNGKEDKGPVRDILKGLVGLAGKGAAAVSRGARWAAPHVASVSKKAVKGARAGAAGVASRIRKRNDSPQHDEPEH